MTKLHHERKPASTPSRRTKAKVPTSQGAIWTRLLESDPKKFTPAAARAILQLTFDDAERSRVHALLVKNQDEALTADERVELDNYLQVSYLLDLMKSKARRALKKPSSKN